MKIRTALTLRYTCITAAVFLVFITAIYYVSEHSRSNAFFRNLKSEAITKAHLFLNNQVDAETMQSIYLNNKKFIDEVEVAVYDTDFRMLYHDALQNDIIKETPEMIERILQKKEIDFYIGDYQGVGIIYTFEGKDYIVTAAAYDGYGYAKREILKETLALTIQRTDRADYCRLPPCPERIGTHQKHRERSGEHNRLTNQQTPARQE